MTIRNSVDISLQLRISGVAVLLALFSLQTTAFAADAYGLGAKDCRSFAKDTSNNKEAEEMYFSWAQGFVSAVNKVYSEMHYHTKDILPPSFSADDQRNYIRDYCAKHPSDLYGYGAMKLFWALPDEQ